MARFNTPTLEERAAASREAKQRQLETLRNKAAPDEATVAARIAAREAREAAEAERRAAHRASIEQKKLAREQARIEAAAAAEREAEARRPPPPPALPTPEEMRAARDARYAARKARQRG